MSIARRLGKNSTIYTFSNVVTKAINFLLLPLYTRFLSPHDYGIFAVVSSIGVFLSIFLLLALDGAMCRFYFEYRNEPEKLKEFWGTIICVISILCFTIGGMFLLFGEVLLKPFIGTI
ncbi:MAG: oligosaccharide flippase family protein, partial [Candidatus Omnitrophica bacterium]|nr:oligosaccharide flippase family protein [Candidatus Omnitrophota bacterium]